MSISGLLAGDLNNKSGAIVQHVTMNYDGFDKSGKRLQPPYPEYWKAFYVTRSGNGGSDDFSTGDFGEGSYGTATISGDATYRCGYDPDEHPEDGWKKGSGPWGFLPYQLSIPPGWSAGGVTHKLVAKWDCRANSRSPTDVSGSTT